MLPHELEAVALTQLYQREKDIGKSALTDPRAPRKRSMKSVHRGVKAFYGRLTRHFEGKVSAHAIPIACKAGCSSCCSLRVEIFDFEAIAIAQHVESALDESTRARIVERLNSASEAAKGLLSSEHFVPCAFLEDHKCTIYDMRPAMCRKYHSVSLQSCLDRGEAKEIEGLKNTTMASFQGFIEGVKQSGMTPTLHELNQALHRLSSDPKAMQHWLHGITVFEPLPEQGGYRRR
jgi:Fe-S-cluster containining protein